MCAGGSRRASVDSIRACTPAIQAWKSPEADADGSVCLLVFIGLRSRRSERLEHVALQDLDLLLGRLQLLLAEARELEAALVRGERLLERKLAALHSRHDFFELGQRFLERKLVCFCAAAGAANGLRHLLVRYCFSRSFTTKC